MCAKKSSLNCLSKREQEVFQLLLQEKSNREISVLLGIAEKTVEEHLTRIYKKLGVRSRTGAVLYGIGEGRDFPH
ncbi:MAG: helix-turn-helix transcriptional regulator [Chloroflexi bacterium]|nr:helix-turn-helix transcriptional regulator [Chloroflexota bacterium]